MKIISRRTLTYFHSGSLVITRAPQTRRPRLFGRKSRMHVDVRRERVEHFLLALVDRSLQSGDAADDLVGRRLVDAALDVRRGRRSR